MRSLLPSLVLSTAMCTLLGGCYFHDHSKDTAASSHCIHATGSTLCQSTDDQNVTGLDTPGVLSHQNQPHE